MLGGDRKSGLGAMLAAEPSVRLAYLFGSQARGDACATSDIDVAVWTDPPMPLTALGALAERLSQAAGGQIDLVDLRHASPLLCRQVVAEGEPLLVRDALQKLDFELDAVRRYEDTRPLRTAQQQLLKDLVNRGRAA
jgi:predicted nucleotidyltransferase